MGHCNALGVVVCPPFHLQAILLGPYMEMEDLQELRGMFLEISRSIKVSDRDMAFAESICPDFSDWWKPGRPCDYKSLSDLVTGKLEEVRNRVLCLFAASC